MKRPRRPTSMCKEHSMHGGADSSRSGGKPGDQLTSESWAGEDWEAMLGGAGAGSARRLLVAPEALLKGDGRMRLTFPWNHCSW